MDGNCDANLNNEDCCFDGGDCEASFGKCPGDKKRLADGICDMDLAIIQRYCRYPVRRPSQYDVLLIMNATKVT